MRATYGMGLCLALPVVSYSVGLCLETLDSLSVVDVTRTEQEIHIVTSQEPYESYTYGMGLCLVLPVMSYSVGRCLVETLHSLSVVDVTGTEQEIHVVISQEP